MVVGVAELLGRFATGTDMGLLAASIAYLPSPAPCANVAPLGGTTRLGHLWTFWRREVGRS